MKEFWIDFDGYCAISAENEEEAMNKFYELIYKCNIDNLVVNVTGTEPKED